MGVPMTKPSVARHTARLSIAGLLSSLVFSGPAASQTIPIVKPSVIRTIPHDPRAYTQGLFYSDGALYESTGLYDRSSLRILDATSGTILKKIMVEKVFAEGIALSGKQLVQLTWREKHAIRYNVRDLKPVGEFPYTGEGWGLTTDSSGFIMSNGSDTLYYRNREFAITRRLPVTLQGKPLRMLNELEYARGLIYANIWYDDRIAEIDPKTGVVRRIIDCTALTAQISAQAGGNPEQPEVLNGIAYDSLRATFYCTGKFWPLIFVVDIPPK
jgi:glutamine cyclotransferase